MIKIDKELTQLLELTEKDTKTVTIAIFIYSKNLTRELENIENIKLNF